MMEFILFVGFGIAGILWLIGLMDWYARKKDRTPTIEAHSASERDQS